jgi:polysaccharide export outer membrane protein
MLLNKIDADPQFKRHGAMRMKVSRLSSMLMSAAIAVLTLGACASAPVEVPPTAAAMAAAQAAEQYTIGPGDTLRIIVMRNPELNAEVPVRPDGKVSTPLADDVVAVGKSPTQLAHDIEAQLANFVRAPTVSVIVVQPTSRYSQVRVVGQAVAPKAIPFRSGMTVLDLVIEVGGLSQFAAGNRAKVIRVDPTTKGSREIRVRLDDLINKGKITENLALQPGDILVIPQTLF